MVQLYIKNSILQEYAMIENCSQQDQRKNIPYNDICCPKFTFTTIQMYGCTHMYIKPIFNTIILGDRILGIFIFYFHSYMAFKKELYYA